MVFVELKLYLGQTTLHGFRYLTTDNCVERTVWSLTLLSSLTIACYLVLTNLEDTTNNPISTSIERIPIQDVPFPAVTINGKYLEHPFRLLMNVFDLYEFDCTFQDNACMERTSQLRSDFKPIIEQVVQKKFYETLEYVTKEDDDLKFAKHICWKPGPNYLSAGALRSLTYGTAVTYARLDHSNQTKLEHDLLQFTSESFRTPSFYFAQEWLKIVKSYYPGFHHFPFMRSSMCQYYFMRQKSEGRKFAIAMHYAMGHHTDRTLGLGRVLQYVVDKLENFIHTSNATEATQLMSDLLGKLFSAVSDNGNNLVKNQGQLESFPLTLKHFFEFLGPKKDTHLALQVPLNQSSLHQCRLFENRYPQPCSINQLSECCKLEKTISSQWESVLMLMKYAIGPQAIYALEPIEILETISNAKVFQYHRRNQNETELPSIKPSIAFCLLGKFSKNKTKGSNDGAVQNCKLFQKTFTTGGIGYTFNTEPFWNMYKDTDGNKAFFRQFNQFELSDNKNKSPLKVERHGSTYTLDLLLFLDDSVTSMTLHDPSTVPDMQNEAINLRPGFENHISVIPSTVKTDESVLKFPLSKRDCLSKSEADNLKVFRMYSQPACLLECQLRVAIDTCNCSTWDYPVLNDSVSYCSVGKSTKCFKDKMADTVPPEQCSCPNDCSMVQYSISKALQPMDKTEFNHGGYYYDLLISSGYYSLIHPHGHSYFDPDPAVPAVNVKDRSRLAHVKIFMAPQTARQIVRTARVTFSDQLAGLGGIMGLFSGMSIISLAEITFWVMRFISRILGKVSNLS